MEQSKERATQNLPFHALAQMALTGVELADRHVATPPDIALGPLNEGNQAWIDGVRAHNAAVRRAALADASEKGIVIPAR